MDSILSAHELIDAQRDRLGTLAQVWLNDGASAFGVWLAGEWLAVWQRDATITAPTLIVPIQFSAVDVGELRVIGIDTTQARARLNAEARLIERLNESENEIEAVAGELIETQDQLLALYDLGKSTRQYFELLPLLRAVCREAIHLVKTRASVAWVILPNGERVVAQAPDEFIVPIEWDDLIYGLTSECVSQATDPGRNSFLVPFHLRGARVAGIGWFDKSDGPFNSPDLKLARAIADQAGAQIENVLLYQETLSQAKLKSELELASRIQIGLMPRRDPSSPGIQVYGHSRPASRVGGDFYDYILRTNASLFFSVGDVAGKGMSAALLMSMVQTTTRNAERFMPHPTPAKILERVSDDLYTELSDLGTFVTLFICQYDSTQRTCTFSNAGHSPVVYRPAHSNARLLMADGMAMGILPNENWVDNVLPLNPGDLLIAATDGFVEAHNAQEEMFGYDALLNLIDRAAELSVSEIGAALYQAVDAFMAGCPQDDDQTIIVIKGN